MCSCPNAIAGRGMAVPYMTNEGTVTHIIILQAKALMDNDNNNNESMRITLCSISTRLTLCFDAWEFTEDSMSIARNLSML